MATVYNIAKARLANGGLDLDTDDIRVLLVNSSYAVNADHDFVNQITNELSGTGYVRKSLAGEVVTEVDASDWAFFDANDVVWTAIDAGTAYAAVVYKFVTVDADSPLIAYVLLTPAVVTNGGDLTVSWSANGILRIA